MLLVFWNGQRLHGNNMLRRLLYEHYLPRLPGGKPHEPLVSVNTCFTYHGGGGYLEAVTEKSLSALVRRSSNWGPRPLWSMPDTTPARVGWTSATRKIIPTGRKIPRGFRPISEPLAKAGVAFGLWFMPEIFGNMADPQVREHFLAVVDGASRNQGMTMYRQDGSRRAAEAAGSLGHRRNEARRRPV